MRGIDVFSIILSCIALCLSLTGLIYNLIGFIKLVKQKKELEKKIKEHEQSSKK